MGVDFITCDACAVNFPDCGPYGFCECGAHYCDKCHEKQQEKYKYNEYNELLECDDCSKNIIRNEDIINHMLNELKTTKDQVIKKIERIRTMKR